MRILVTLGLFMALAACVGIGPESKYSLAAGDEFYAKGRYEEAKTAYAASIYRFSSSMMAVGRGRYGLARSQGQLCEFDDAVKNFTEASKYFQMAFDGKPNIFLTQSYFELARLYYDYGDYSGAITPFQKAVVLADDLNAANRDPIGYADVLEDYRAALEKTENTSRAIEIQGKINSLRKSHPGVKASFHVVRFNVKCKRMQ